MAVRRRARIAIDARKIADFGIGTYVRGLVSALAAIDADHDYLLLVAARSAVALPDLPGHFRIVPEESPLYSLREQVGLSLTLARHGADLYHSTHYVLPLWLPCPAVVTIHDLIHLLYPEFLGHPAAHLYARWMIGRALRRGRKIIAVSENTRADLERHFAVDPRKLTVIHNGVEARFRRPLPEHEIQRFLARHELAKPYLLFVGNPKPHKNLDNLLRAFALSCAEGLGELELVCAGAREPARRAEELATHLGVRERVRFLGHLPFEELPALYRGARLFVYPSLYEGFGLPVAEAMACGVPVLTSNGSALAEIAGEAAECVDPLDVPALAASIRRCALDEERRRLMSARGRERAADWTWERVAERSLALYRELLGETGAPPAARGTA